MYAPGQQSALEDIERFSQEFKAKYAKAAECLTKDQDELLTFFDFPAEHWIHLRTTNPIESTFSTVKVNFPIVPYAIESGGCGALLVGCEGPTSLCRTVGHRTDGRPRPERSS